MTMSLTSVPLSTINMLHIMFSCVIRLLALFMNVFPLRATVQRKLTWMENNWWVWKAAQIQSYANINDAKSFYEALNGVYGPSRFSLHPVRSTDGVLLKNKELILKRWAEYLQNLLNKVHTTDPGFLDDLPTLLIIP